MTSSNGNIFRVTGPLCGEFTGPGEFPTQRPVTRSFDVFFDLRLNKRLSKHSWGWWFETLSLSLWRHHNVIDITFSMCLRHANRQKQGVTSACNTLSSRRRYSHSLRTKHLEECLDTVHLRNYVNGSCLLWLLWFGIDWIYPYPHA